MCLAYPAKLLSVEPDGSARADVLGVQRTITLIAVTEPVEPGDWVIVHAGLALHRITESEATALEEAHRHD
jgi:hydrogenase expression/formation protein HypC